MSEWRFRRRQGACVGCEKRFADGESHISTLRVSGEELARDDLCSNCWRRADPALDLVFWKTRHHENARQVQLDLATMEQIFLSLEGRTEERLNELRYVLCLLLMRKRRLKLDRVVRGNSAEGVGESMLMHRPRRKESLRVFVFDFTPERMEELRSDLMALFEGAEPAPNDSGASDAGSEAEPAALSAS